MDKELEALNNLFDLVTCQDSFEKAQKYYYIIEEALERLKAIETIECSEALKELNEIIEYITEDKKVKYKATILFDCEIIKDALIKAQKEHKILKIIKEKRVDLCILTDCDNVNEYNKSLGNLRPVEDRLTYDEFILLKEWLKNE